MHRSGELKCHERRIKIQLVVTVIASLRRVNDDVNGHSVHLHQAADCKPSTG